ncbi:MAG: VCBS repeat-containing protein [Phycisphaerales bacterium]|nr:MAG: VCBS repeat-containing protein [Phycisphaerales bacterium]
MNAFYINLASSIPVAVMLLFVFAIELVSPALALAESPDAKTAAELDSRRLIGKAYYENDNFTDAAGEFRKCIELAPDSATDYFNLGLILMRAQEYEESLAALTKAKEHDPDLLAVPYIEGIIFKRQGEYEKAAERLEYVIKKNPECRGAYYNLGVCYKFLQRYEDAIAAFLKKAELDTTDPSTQYQLITLYRRTGQVDNAERHTEIYDRVKDTVDEVEKTAEALERSQYTYIIEAPRLTPDLKPQTDATVKFVEATEQMGLPKPGTFHPGARTLRSSGIPQGGAPAETLRDYYVPLWGSAVVLGDYDSDWDLDIYVVNASTEENEAPNRLYQNGGNGKFIDVTSAVGVGDPGLGIDAAFGDIDNDGYLDLYVANFGPNVLYHNRGDGTFEDISEEAHANEPQFGRTTLLVDYDHDNDLDIFVANCLAFAPKPETPELTQPGDYYFVPQDCVGQSNTILRNNGNGTFSDLTDEAGLLLDLAQSQDAVVADFDGDHDLDIFVGNAGAESRLFCNARLGKLAQGGSFVPPLPETVRDLTEADFNRDGHFDLIIGGSEGSKPCFFLYANDGHANFVGEPIPMMAKWAGCPVRVFDYNNDGWLDLLHPGVGKALHLLVGRERGEFSDVSEEAGLRAIPNDINAAYIADIATGDLDSDGDEDIVLHTIDKGPIILRNDGGNKNNWLNVKLVGKKVNRSAYGSTVEIASGGHYQKKTYNEGPVHFGLGNLKEVDVVRVTWPNGVAQNVIKPKINETLVIEEYVKVSASCAFLYTWNGKGFELVNEILGIGPLGVPMAPGVYYPLDCTELTKIEAGQLVPKDGVYELRLTEELREITYADQITLRVIDHPEELEVVPNEMFTMPPFPEEKFFAVGDGRPPVSAIDDRGQDVRDLILKHDGRYPTFPLVEQHDGLAELHSLTLDLGDLSDAKHIMLYLDSWIYWADSSTGMAIAQDPRYGFKPLTLEVRDERGEWRGDASRKRRECAVGISPGGASDMSPPAAWTNEFVRATQNGMHSWKAVIDWVGLPTSKGIVVPVDLTGKFLCDDYHVRLSTNLRVYFDRIFISTSDRADECRAVELPVKHADIHYRGFSRMSRDEHGFERFDYQDASPTGSWSPPAGMFTKYGEVTELLAEPDDMYVIFGPGDELTMRFDATNLPVLPPGWTRDFIFYANGWVKDGDLNTKFSDTVEPLPFHAMSGYPYGADEHYPDTPEHQRYLSEYNTRPSRSTVGALLMPTQAVRTEAENGR